MGLSDRSWRQNNQEPISSLRPQPAWHASRSPLPNRIPQGAQTLHPSGRLRPNKPAHMGAVPENAACTQVSFKPKANYSSALRHDGGANIVTQTTNHRKEEPQRQSDRKSQAASHGIHISNKQRIERPIHLLKFEFERGMIINAPLFQEDRHQGKFPSDNVSVSTHGIVYSKSRYMIIVGLHHASYTTVSLYTHERKGLHGKETYKNEFISVRDGRIPSHGFKRQSDYDELVTDGTGARISELSTAWLTHPVARDYDLGVQLHGRLAGKSTQRLLNYVRELTSQGLGF